MHLEDVAGRCSTRYSHVTWADVDLAKSKFHVRGDPETGTKDSETRVVPLIPELQSMLEKMRSERADGPIDTPIMRVHECQKSMDRAAKIVGMERITHHDLRRYDSDPLRGWLAVRGVSSWEDENVRENVLAIFQQAPGSCISTSIGRQSDTGHCANVFEPTRTQTSGFSVLGTFELTIPSI